MRVFRWMAVLVAVVGAEPSLALTAHLITGNALVNHAPGSDFRIGTSDDLVRAGGLGIDDAGPNAHGATSFALLNGDPPLGDNPDLNDYDYGLFVDGTLEFTPSYTASTADDLVLTITGGTLRSTAEFSYPTREESTTLVTAGEAHTNPLTGAGSVRLTATFGPEGLTFPLTNELLTAAAGGTRIVLRTSIGHSGNSYVDEVLAPLVPPDATAIVLVDFTGTVATATCCRGFTTRGTLAAYTTDDLGCADVFPALCGGGSGGGGGACATVDACGQALGGALPAPPAATSRRSRTVARRLRKLDVRATRLLARAVVATGRRQAKLYKKARSALASLLGVARTANGKGVLDVPLDPIESSITALRALLPS